MILGGVTADGLPIITLPVGGRNWSAVVDTGFNGDLELPDALRPLVNPQFAGGMYSVLAGGQVLEEDCYLVDFPFDGTMLRVEATFVAGADILLGTHLLRRHKLEVDFPAATVRLECMP